MCLIKVYDCKRDSFFFYCVWYPEYKERFGLQTVESNLLKLLEKVQFHTEFLSSQSCEQQNLVVAQETVGLKCWSRRLEGIMRHLSNWFNSFLYVYYVSYECVCFFG
jgi:hypothetical protein